MEQEQKKKENTSDQQNQVQEKALTQPAQEMSVQGALENHSQEQVGIIEAETNLNVPERKQPNLLKRRVYLPCFRIFI